MSIYGIPYNSTDILVIDPIAGTATRSAMGATLTGGVKWRGGVLGPDGKIYGIPLDSTDVLVIDPATGTATPSAMGATLTGGAKWQGGALGPDGKIYGIPFDSTDILVIDPIAGTATRSAMGATLTGTFKWLSGVRSWADLDIGGTIDAISATTGVITATLGVTATAASTSTTSGTVTSARATSGAIDAISTVFGELTADLVLAPTSIDAISTVTGTLGTLVPVSGMSVDAVSTVFGELAADLAIDGAVVAGSLTIGSVLGGVTAVICRPWQVDLSACCRGTGLDPDNPADAARIDSAVAQVSSMLNAWSGRAYGGCRTVRPLDPCGTCRGGCCSSGDCIVLHDATTVMAVRIDGVPVNNAYWHFDGARGILCAIPPYSWPSYDPRFEATGSLEVDIQSGATPDAWALAVAAELTCEILLSCAGSKCRIPRNATQVSSQGVTITLTEDEIRYAIPSVAAWVASVNPASAVLPARIFSPEASTQRVQGASRFAYRGR